jgi:hypothetical protein
LLYASKYVKYSSLWSSQCKNPRPLILLVEFLSSSDIFPLISDQSSNAELIDFPISSRNLLTSKCNLVSLLQRFCFQHDFTQTSHFDRSLVSPPIILSQNKRLCCYMKYVQHAEKIFFKDPFYLKY